MAFLSVLLVSGLTGALHFCMVHGSANVSGVISVDTTWTKANSPYSLTGPTAVGNGVTITIEAGVIVNLNSYYIQVNGTLVARGTDADKIYFNGGSISFESSSVSWNEQTGSGSIIENANVSSRIGITTASIKINNNLIGSEIIIENSSTIVSNNKISNFLDILGVGTPTISNNIINGGISVGGDFYGSTLGPIGSGSILISNNTITGGYAGISVASPPNYFETPRTNYDLSIFDNTISGCTYAISLKGTGTIERNLIVNNENGILFQNVVTHSTDRSTSQSMGNLIIRNNNVGNNSVGIGGQGATIERNLISNNTIGIDVGSQVTIQNNAIAGNTIGIQTSSPMPAIIYNNIQNNVQYSIYLESTPTDLNATYNWWGTTDAQAINQTIHYFKDDFNLGAVNFVPFLTEPNPSAPTVSITIPSSTNTPNPSPTQSQTPASTFTSNPTPTSSPSQNPTSPSDQTNTQTPPQTGLYTVIVILAVAVAALSIAVVALIRIKSTAKAKRSS